MRSPGRSETQRPVGHGERRANRAGRGGIVAGGGGGLGRACALDLGRAGMQLGLCDRNPELLAETRRVLESSGAAVEASVLDVRDPDDLAAFFSSVDRAFGAPLHALVNVVGGTYRQPFEASGAKGWDALMRTNFTWLLHAIQLAIPRMREGGGGSIVNLTSVEGHRAAPGFAVYAAMKAAVTSLGRSLAVELAPDGIRVNAIAPDFTPTEGTDSITPGGPAAGRSGTTGEGAAGEETAALADRIGIPMGRKGTYDDVGGCALFLASDLSRYVTGQTLHPDGGVTAASGWFNWPETGWGNMPPADAVRPYLSAGTEGGGQT